MTDIRAAHWQKVYSQKAETEVSWFEESPGVSLSVLAELATPSDAAIIDIGGGASRMPDALLERGFTDITVLDLSQAALDSAKARLGPRAHKVNWIAADATRWEPKRSYDVWHDRAAFHFLTEAEDRAAYIENLRRGLKPGGYVSIASFAPDGPEKCSGLAVMRYDSESLGRELGARFTLVNTNRFVHATPWQSEQRFQISVFRFAREP